MLPIADAIVETEETLVPVVDLGGRPLTPCSPEKARQNLIDGLATMDNGQLRLNYRPLAYRRIYRQVRQRDGNVCAWCQEPGSTLEHVLPISWGGRTSLDNCVIACRSCNHSRTNTLASEFMALTHFRPTHPVILHTLRHEAELIRQATRSLATRPIQSCVSKEEAQIWVAYRQAGQLLPPPPKAPATRLRSEGEPFLEVFLP